MAKSKKNEAPAGAAPKKKTTPKQTKAASIVAVPAPPKARSTRRSRAACPSGVVVANKSDTADAPGAGDVEFEAALTAPPLTAAGLEFRFGPYWKWHGSMRSTLPNPILDPTGSAETCTEARLPLGDPTKSGSDPTKTTEKAPIAHMAPE